MAGDLGPAAVPDVQVEQGGELEEVAIRRSPAAVDLHASQELAPGRPETPVQRVDVSFLGVG